MKTNLPLPSLLMISIVAFLAACGGGKQQATAPAGDTAIAEEPTQGAAVLPQLTADSIGCIVAGMPVDSLPGTSMPLYDEIKKESDDEYTQYTFLAEGTPMVAALDFGSGRVDAITLLSPLLEARASRGTLRLGDSFGRLLAMRGTQAEWAGYDAVGRWTWTNSGLWFMPDEQTIAGSEADKLHRRLYDSMEAPDPEDFNRKVTIGYIGTGLPF